MVFYWTKNGIEASTLRNICIYFISGKDSTPIGIYMLYPCKYKKTVQAIQTLVCLDSLKKNRKEQAHRFI